MLSALADIINRVRAVPTVMLPSYLVEYGNLYYYNEVTALNNASRVIHIKTGAKSCLMSASLSAGSKATVTLLEAPTVTADGTAVTINNYNRNFEDNKLVTKLYHTPTVTGSTGKTIKSNQSGFGTNPGNAVSGASGTDRAYKLKPFTSYVYTITMAGNSDIVLGLELYEP
jgi:hypothetical protein